LKRTIESVLVQDPGPEKMQIEVVDDCSRDGDVKKLVEEVGKGRVQFYQQTENRGSLRNFETCLNRSRGYYIHLLHGDDLIKPGFYKEIETLFSTYPQVGAAFTNYNWINEKEEESAPTRLLLPEPGIIDNWLYKIASKQRFTKSWVVFLPFIMVKTGKCGSALPRTTMWRIRQKHWLRTGADTIRISQASLYCRVKTLPISKKLLLLCRHIYPQKKGPN
jgi:cellulose synthase/poly-beta-1,6-N-acetylglucosamine synthase-like glycosyltransferase